MLAALRYLDARLAEASTWSAIAGLLAGAGVALPPGLIQQLAFWGMLAAGLLGVLLSEAGKKPPAAILLDAIAAAGPLLAQVRAAQPAPPSPANDTTPAAVLEPPIAAASKQPAPGAAS